MTRGDARKRADAVAERGSVRVRYLEPAAEGEEAGLLISVPATGASLVIPVSTWPHLVRKVRLAKKARGLPQDEEE